MFIVGFAVALDALEIAVELFTTALGATTLGVAGGCALGAQYAGAVGCKVGGALGGIIGIFAQGTGAGEVMGALLGYVIDASITVGLGTMLVMFLVLSGRMSLKNFMYTTGVFVFKLLPIFGLAPGWTKYAWDCTGNEKEVLDAARENNILSADYTSTPEATRRQMQDMVWYPPRTSQPNEQTA